MVTAHSATMDAFYSVPFDKYVHLHLPSSHNQSVCPYAALLKRVITQVYHGYLTCTISTHGPLQKCLVRLGFVS